MPIRLLTLAAAFLVALAAGGIAGNAAVSGVNGLSDSYALPEIGAEAAALASVEAGVSPDPAPAMPEELALATYEEDAPEPEPEEPPSRPDEGSYEDACEPDPRIYYADHYVDDPTGN